MAELELGLSIFVYLFHQSYDGPLEQDNPYEVLA